MHQYFRPTSNTLHHDCSQSTKDQLYDDCCIIWNICRSSDKDTLSPSMMIWSPFCLLAFFSIHPCYSLIHTLTTALSQLPLSVSSQLATLIHHKQPTTSHRFCCMLYITPTSQVTIHKFCHCWAIFSSIKSHYPATSMTIPRDLLCQVIWNDFYVLDVPLLNSQVFAQANCMTVKIVASFVR